MSPLYGLAVTVVALWFCGRLARFNPPADFRRFRTLDGLRGLAALAVFLEHTIIWYRYNLTGSWTNPPSNVYTQCGQGGVTIFFLITSFLFWDKIKSARNGTIDWTRFYVARAMRLLPLFYVSVIVIFLLAWSAARGRAPILPNGSLLDTLTLFPHGVPDFFGGANVYFYNAGVTWSLIYELFFYLLLPVVYILIKPFWAWNRFAIMAAQLTLLWALAHYANIAWLFTRIFFIGVIAYEIAASPLGQKSRGLLAGPVGSVAIAAILIVLVNAFNSAFYFRAELLYGVIAFIILVGNDFFGLLTLPATRKLGEISYSVYLLQGFVLYQIFHHDHHLSMPVSLHWTLAGVACVVLLAIANVTFTLIERPAMALTPVVTRGVKHFFRRVGLGGRLRRAD